MISGITHFNGVEASVSGINGGRVVQQAASVNIANVNSEGFQAYKVNLSEAYGGGVEASVSRSDMQPMVMYNSDGTTSDSSNVSLIEEITSLKMGGLMVDANAAALSVQNKATGTIIDMIA